MASDESTTQFSRRQFLGTCGAVGATAALPTTTVGQAAPGRFDALAGLDPTLPRVSPEGKASIRAFDRRFQQKRPDIRQTLHAVENLGLDPSGNTPVGRALSKKISGLSNTRVVFPSDGEFLFEDQSVIRPAGPVELIGNGCTFKIPSNTAVRLLNIDQFPSGSLLRGFVLDQTAPKSRLGWRLAADGVVRADNITVKGYATAKPVPGSDEVTGGIFSPVAYESSSVIRATNFHAAGGSASGVHDINGGNPPSVPENRLDAPMGVWIGQSTQGTIQLVNPTLRGWGNAIYGGRTLGRYEVLGGRLVNNDNCQARVGGGSVVDGATMILDDRQWSDKGPFKLGRNQGVYAVRVDPADIGNRTDPVRIVNVGVYALSMQEGASLFDFEAEAGPGILQNCKIMNHLDRPVIMGVSPSGGAPQTNIMVDHCLIGGSSPAAVMEIDGRPQSRIQYSCITIPDAGPEDINGADIGPAVSFGKCGPNSGLKKPKKVGEPGDLPPLPDYPDSPNGGPGNGGPGREGPSKDVFVAVIDGIFMLLFILFGMIALFVGAIVAAVGALAAMIGGD